MADVAGVGLLVWEWGGVVEGEWWRGSVTGWKGGESEGLEVSWTYLMVMMPTPVSRPMRIHSCQNSSLVRRAKPVMSRQCE